MDNKQLVIKRIGDVQLKEGMFTETQRMLFEKVIKISDRNPIIDWKRNESNHNLDFCLIAGNIEPVKNFCLKVQYIASLNMRAHEPQIIESNTDTRITVPVTIDDGKRHITMNGGSTLIECGYPKERRAFHFAVARAQTRGFKLSLEAFMGFPFINLAIKSLFGGFEIKGKPDKADIRDVTEQETEVSEKNELLYAEIRGILVKAYREGFMSEIEGDDWTKRLKANIDKLGTLLDYKEQIKTEIRLKKEKQK